MSTRAAARSLVTAPALEPVTIEEAKRHLVIETTDRDAEVERLVKASRRWCERYTRRAFITQTWDLKLDCFPECIELPLAPLQSVTAASFTYVDEDGTTTQVSSSVYTVDTASEPGRVYLAYNQDWPAPRAQPHAISLRFVAGYGNSGDDVPDEIRQAILQMCGTLSEFKETMVIGAIVTQVPFAVESLLGPYQMPPEF